MKINNPWRDRFVFTSGTPIVYVECDIYFISKWSWHPTPETRAVWTRILSISHVRLHSYKNTRRLRGRSKISWHDSTHTYYRKNVSIASADFWTAPNLVHVSSSMSGGPDVTKGCLECVLTCKSYVPVCKGWKWCIFPAFLSAQCTWPSKDYINCFKLWHIEL